MPQPTNPMAMPRPQLQINAVNQVAATDRAATGGPLRAPVPGQRPTVPGSGPIIGPRGNGPASPAPRAAVPPAGPTPAPQQPGFRQGAGYQNWQSGNNAQRQQFLQRQQRMQQAGGIQAIRDARARQQPPPIQTSMPQVQANALGSGFAAIPEGAAGQWRPDRIWT